MSQTPAAPLLTEDDASMRHVIAALVTNEPGVLAQVAGMFAARGFNIDSLVVGRTENPELSRMTIVVPGNHAVLEQVRKQLQKLVPVVKVVDYHEVPFVERDLLLVQVSTKGFSEGGTSRGDADKREEIITLANLFRAKCVDVSKDRLMIELAGAEEKVEAFLALLEPYGIIELARSGIIAMPRGHAAPMRRPPLGSGGGAGHGRGGDESEGGVDLSALPPG